MVVDEACVAAIAAGGPGALGAQEERRVTAPIREHDHLPPFGEGLGDARDEGGRERTAHRAAAQIDDLDRGI